MVRAIIIDDEELLCELFAAMLSQQGYDVEVSVSANGGLERLRTGHFDVVLLDLMLGSVSGLDVLEKIRQMYYPPVVIVMTGYGSTEVAVEAMKQGAADFIMKPVDPMLMDIRIRKALDERRAQRLAITDGLTGIYNRRYFEERLEEETRRARRYGRPMSLLMFDIDFFKNYNDTCGHLKGDEVLRKIALTLQRYSRETDIAARYGGEEFVMILPETDGQNASRLADRIRMSIAETPFEGESQIPSGKVTVSVGVSCLLAGEEGYDALERADRALYMSKQNGKNRVTAYPGDGSEP
ncbi:MAG: diguanylate cyclase [candidate division Zixibacteria bacterium]|nr:diguanylate cyclase [candidate division Zixibacteria bacterium]